MKHENFVKLPSIVKTLSSVAAMHYHEENPSSDLISEEDVHDYLEELGDIHGLPEGYWLEYGELTTWTEYVNHALIFFV